MICTRSRSYRIRAHASIFATQKGSPRLLCFYYSKSTQNVCNFVAPKAIKWRLETNSYAPHPYTNRISELIICLDANKNVYRFILLVYIWSVLLTVVHSYIYYGLCIGIGYMSLTLRLKPIIHIWWRDKRKLRRYNVRFTYDRIHCMCHFQRRYYARVKWKVAGLNYFIDVCYVMLFWTLLDLYFHLVSFYPIQLGKFFRNFSMCLQRLFFFRQIVQIIVIGPSRENPGRGSKKKRSSSQRIGNSSIVKCKRSHVVTDLSTIFFVAGPFSCNQRCVNFFFKGSGQSKKFKRLYTDRINIYQRVANPYFVTRLSRVKGRYSITKTK